MEPNEQFKCIYMNTKHLYNCSNGIAFTENNELLLGMGTFIQ